jgi:HEAT repeat protein
MKRSIRLAVFAVLGAVGGDALAAEPPTSVPSREARYEGKVLADWLARLQKAETDDAREKAATAIAVFGADAVPALVEMLQDRSDQFRKLVLSTLGQIGPAARGATPALLDALQQKVVRTPKEIVATLGKIGPDPALAAPALLAALEQPESTCVALEVLCATGSPNIDPIPPLRRALRKARLNKEYWSSGSLRDLAKLGAPAVPLLLEFLDDTDIYAQAASADGLGAIGPAAKPAVPALCALLQSKTDYVRLEAAVALWRIDKNPAAIPAIVALLGGCLDQYAAERLGDRGAPAKSALPELMKKLNDRDALVRSAARAAILKIDPEALEQRR